jgi:hypothetical protein
VAQLMLLNMIPLSAFSEIAIRFRVTTPVM